MSLVPSCVCHIVTIIEFKLALRSKNAEIRAKIVLTSVTLTLDLWPWSFAWTSRLSMVITSDNFMMIRWQEYCEKVWQTNGRADKTVLRVGSQLNTIYTTWQFRYKHLIWRLSLSRVCNTEPGSHRSTNSYIQNNQTVCNRHRSAGCNAWGDKEHLSRR